MRNAIVFTALALLLASCAAPSTPLPGPTSTRTQAPSLTPEPAPSLAPSPTTTSEPTLSPGPSPSAAGSSTPFPTPTVSKALDCALLMQSVKNGTHYKSREEFSIGWKVRNTGTAGWDPVALDFMYIAGTRMYQYPSTQLQGAVDPGNTVILSADLRAPRNPGKYSTSWTLRQGDNYFCRVSLTIFVN
jgi:Ig-like domain from next to BRCA1 gene